MCRMAGGWPGERTEKKLDCGGVKEQRRYGATKEEGNPLSRAPRLTELLVEMPELKNVKHLAAFEKLLSSQKSSTVLVQANENKER
ncbi:hypothetical protein VZT92_012908 [Zoarces viviparus]|uniref:Uncharacterized protein n=1 Tax=Zoarces viviparus TaxID=48416 RepID=A0AAW1F368_ZOAVI